MAFISTSPQHWAPSKRAEVCNQLVMACIAQPWFHGWWFYGSLTACVPFYVSQLGPP